MGFKREVKIYKLVFEDPDLEGLEVRTRSVPLGKFLEMQDIYESDMTKAAIDELFTKFAELIVSWNLEDENDVPVPTTMDGLYTLDLEFARDIIGAWKDAMTGVAAPLETPSHDGGQSPVVSIPMDSLSPSQAS